MLDLIVKSKELLRRNREKESGGDLGEEKEVLVERREEGRRW